MIKEMEANGYDEKQIEEELGLPAASQHDLPILDELEQGFHLPAMGEGQEEGEIADEAIQTE
jgi:hypothetical protein